jgi:hypothetical protein
MVVAFFPPYYSYTNPLAFIDERTQKNIMTDIKKLNKLTKKDYLKILIFVVTFLIARTIFSDWEHFKAGLFGF